MRAAAREAGIAPQFVDRALVELDAEGAAGTRDPDVVDRLAARFLGDPPPHLVVSRVVDAPPSHVYRTLQQVLPAPPFSLVLVDAAGGAPLEGGVLVFDVPEFTWTSSASTQGFAYEMTWCDVKQLRVRLAALGHDEGACEIGVVAPLDYSLRLNFWIGGSLVAVAALVVAAALAAGGATAGAATLGWRAVYRYALRRGERALDKLLQQVDVAVRTGGAFASPRRAFPPLSPDGEGGVTPPA